MYACGIRINTVFRGTSGRDSRRGRRSYKNFNKNRILAAEFTPLSLYL